MAGLDYLVEVIVILMAAVVGVSLFLRLRLGPVLGYLATGVVIGPAGLGLTNDSATVQALAELGVVFLLFTAGLELPIRRVRAIGMRTLWLGAAQVVITTVALAAIAYPLLGNLAAAVIVGGALSLSSTAIVLRLLTDRGELTSRVGRIAFAILLIQDLSVGPLLILVLAIGQESASIGPTILLAIGKGALALVVIVVIGRVALDPLFRLVAAGRNPEVFSALTLLVILCLGFATHLAGLSMAFGGFIAGMLLADTGYRHQVAVEIRPFRGLLLGLFFITVGMHLDLAGIVGDAPTILVLIAVLIVCKAVVLTLLALPVAPSLRTAGHIALLLSQSGEFAFVLIGAGVASGGLDGAHGNILLIVVTASMALTPLLAHIGSRLSANGGEAPDAPPAADGDMLDDASDHVVIAGYGRVGNMVARMLHERHIRFVAVDLDPKRVAAARRQGMPVFYGDATGPEVLEALHINTAAAMVVTLGDPRSVTQLVGIVEYIFPELPVFARAYDEEHARALEKAGADLVVAELVDTASRLAGPLIDTLAPRSNQSDEAAE